MNFLRNKKWLYYFFVFLFFCFFVFSAVDVCWAAGFVPTPTGSCPENATCSNGICGGNSEIPCDYSLNDFVRVAIAVANWIWAISGSLALLAFVYGGVMFLISAGSSEKIAKAKQIIVSAIVGLIIVFTSYLIIGFILTELDVAGADQWATLSR